MLPIATLLFGAILGWVRATRRQGNLGDKLQFAIGHAVAFGLAGMLLGVILARTGFFPGG